MHSEFWHERWREGRTKFHQTKVNSRLRELWPTLGIDPAASVLVPLCGKSLDMLMLQQLGHSVVGVELSEIATEAFFTENQLPYETSQTGNLQEFTGTESAAGLRLFAGDIFSLDAAQTGACRAFYDRAALIALPPEMRQQYVDKLASILPTGAIGLLISLIYDPNKMQGPPFSVPHDEVMSLFAGKFSVEQIDYSSGPERLGSLATRGLETMEERVYRLVRS